MLPGGIPYRYRSLFRSVISLITIRYSCIFQFFSLPYTLHCIQSPCAISVSPKHQNYDCVYRRHNQNEMREDCAWCCDRVCNRNSRRRFWDFGVFGGVTRQTTVVAYTPWVGLTAEKFAFVRKSELKTAGSLPKQAGNARHDAQPMKSEVFNIIS